MLAWRIIIYALLLATPANTSMAREDGRYFMIYFRWNSSVVPSSMHKRIVEAAKSAKQHRSSHVEVIGYTDTFMSITASIEISARMAKSVADELVRHGIPPGTLVYQGRGEENLIRPTADGIKEPHNRRVEIIIY